jgi:hypothetical protein
MELFKPEKRLMNHPIHFGENPLVILSNFSHSALKQGWSQLKSKLSFLKLPKATYETHTYLESIYLVLIIVAIFMTTSA